MTSKNEDPNYEEKLKSLPSDLNEKQEHIADLKITAALEHDKDVDDSQVETWLENAKKGHKSRFKVTSTPWQYAAASLVLIFPVVGILIMSLNFETDYDEIEKTIVVVTEMVSTEEQEEIGDIVSRKEKIEPFLPTPKPVLSIAKSPELKLKAMKSSRESIVEELEFSSDSLVVTGLSEPLISNYDSSPVLNSKMPAQSKMVKKHAIRTSKPSSISILEEVFRGEQYEHIPEKSFVFTSIDSKATMSVDVDTASYSNMRRFIQSGSLPRPDSVRIEEMINYFNYDYKQPEGELPFSVTTKLENNLWKPSNKILHIGLQGKQVMDRPEANIVFLLDVSGSMNNSDKLPLLKRGFKLMLNNLNENDKVSIVAYAGRTGVVLKPTPVTERLKIEAAMDQLVASGSTNGEGGIQLAYRLAKDHFIKGGINRVILATDGDFNVGLSGTNQLEQFISEKRKTGVELSVLGFGQGNIRDDIMERLADHGNGNYAYIDSIAEARKALVSQLSSTLVTIAKDVKLQLDFNPDVVKAFRQIGYENRTLAHKDFDNDKKDAGEIGAGHTVTALYEIEFHEGYENSKDLGHFALRYKKPQADESHRVDYLLSETITKENKVSWATAMAAFGQKLRGNQFTKKLDYKTIIEQAKANKGKDTFGYRSEAINLMQQVSDLLGTAAEPVGDYPEWKVRRQK